MESICSQFNPFVVRLPLERRAYKTLNPFLPPLTLLLEENNLLTGVYGSACRCQAATEKVQGVKVPVSNPALQENQVLCKEATRSLSDLQAQLWVFPAYFYRVLPLFFGLLICNVDYRQLSDFML